MNRRNEMSELSILVIEDDEIAAEILQQFIHQYHPHAKVEWCWNGFEALIRVEEVKPDLIFLDFMMPKIDGMEFLQAVKDSDALDQKTRIIVVSAYVDDAKKAKFLSMGVDEVLDKPINIEAIRMAVERMKA